MYVNVHVIQFNISLFMYVTCTCSVSCLAYCCWSSIHQILLVHYCGGVKHMHARTSSARSSQDRDEHLELLQPEEQRASFANLYLVAWLVNFRRPTPMYLHVAKLGMNLITCSRVEKEYSTCSVSCLTYWCWYCCYIYVLVVLVYILVNILYINFK